MGRLILNGNESAVKAAANPNLASRSHPKTVTSGSTPRAVAQLGAPYTNIAMITIHSFRNPKILSAAHGCGASTVDRIRPRVGEPARIGTAASWIRSYLSDWQREREDFGARREFRIGYRRTLCSGVRT